MPSLKTLRRELGGGIAIALVILGLIIGTVAMAALFMAVTEPSQQGLRWRHSHKIVGG